MVTEVGQRVTQRRQFPVQHGNDARPFVREDHVVEPKVAVHDGRRGAVQRTGRQAPRQPLDQVGHLGDVFRDAGQVLLAPAADLTLEVVARLAVVLKACGGHVHAVQRGDDTVHFVVDGAAPGRCHGGQRLVPQHAASHETHDVESAADDGFVFAQQQHRWHRHTRRRQALHDAELTFYGVRRGQQLRGRAGLRSHHVGAARCLQLVGGVALAALELLDGERALKAWQSMLQMRLQCGHVEGVALGHGLGAGELFHRHQPLRFTCRPTPSASRVTAPRAAWVPRAQRRRARNPSVPG